MPKTIGNPLSWGVDAAKNGTVPPVAVWLGNVILFCCGAYLLRKVIRWILRYSSR